MENIYFKINRDLTIDEYLELLNESIQLDARRYDNGEFENE